jgi:excisionase family DNA binding protein
MQVSQTVSQTLFPLKQRHPSKPSCSHRKLPDFLCTGSRISAQVLHIVVSAWRVCALSLSYINLETRTEKLFEKVFQVSNLLTLEQVASKLAVSKRSVQRIIKAGQIEVLRLSPGIVRVRDTALERYLDRIERSQRLSGVNQNG